MKAASSILLLQLPPSTKNFVSFFFETLDKDHKTNFVVVRLPPLRFPPKFTHTIVVGAKII